MNYRIKAMYTHTYYTNIYIFKLSFQSKISQNKMQLFST